MCFKLALEEGMFGSIWYQFQVWELFRDAHDKVDAGEVSSFPSQRRAVVFILLYRMCVCVCVGGVFVYLTFQKQEEHELDSECPH